jgi:hypothetical protein
VLFAVPEAIEAVFPATTVQTCIVHLIRQSLRYVPRRSYDQVVKDLRPIYTAVDADAALAALGAFEEKWGDKLPVIGQAWRNSWEYVIPFLAFEPEVRRVIYTTDERVKGCAGRPLPESGAVEWSRRLLAGAEVASCRFESSTIGGFGAGAGRRRAVAARRVVPSAPSAGVTLRCGRG